MIDENHTNNPFRISKQHMAKGMISDTENRYANPRLRAAIKLLFTGNQPAITVSFFWIITIMFKN